MFGQLTNHLWQSTLFALGAAMLAFAVRKNQAQVRYWLWLSASLKFFVPFSLLTALGSYFEWSPAARHSAAHAATQAVTVKMVQFTQPFPNVIQASHSPARNAADWTLAILFGLWLCGFFGVALARLRVWMRIRAALRNSAPLDLATAIPVRSAPGLLEPGVVGLFNPVLLVPSSIVGRLTPAHLDAVLAHEVWHVRRRDNLFSSIHMLAEAVFWFHPFVWWIGAKLVEEREQACDEGVLALGNEPQVYAEAIVNVCKLYVETPLPCVSGVTGADLQRRIEAIMNHRATPALDRGRKLILAAAGTAAIVGPVVIGIGNASTIRTQSHSAPAFEFASIGRTDPGFQGRFVQVPGDDSRFQAAGVTLRELIEYAYDVHPSLVIGGPAWTSADRFNVLGHPEGERIPSAEERRQMVKTLLADRFHLEIHRERRVTGVYELMPAASGVKMKQHTPDDGGAKMSLFFRAASVPARDVPMNRFAGALQGMLLDRPVLDKTGLKGTWDFDFSWKSGSDGSSVAAALEEQLGLHLETGTAPLDAIVIDRAQEPSVN